jgi:hypothetical protein
LAVRPLDAVAEGDVDALRVGRDLVALGQPRDLFAGVVVVQIEELEDRLVQDVAHATQAAQRVRVHVGRVLDLGQARAEA